MKTALDPRKTWWWRGEVQTRLAKWTLALLQGQRYTVRLEAGGVGYHDPDKRIIQANPQLFPAEPPQTQFRLTQGILAHEVGHAWFTGAWPDQSEGRLQEMVNLLEDERVERGVCVLYPGVAPAIRLLGDQMLAQTRALERRSERDQAYACCLVWRWAHGRIGEEAMFEQLKISDGAQCLWEKVRSRVERSWTAESTAQVIALGRQIMEILGIPPGEKPLKPILLNLGDRPSIPGKREGAPQSFPAGPASIQPGLGGREVEESVPWFADRYSRPAPYLDLEQRARPLARRLSQALQLPAPQHRLEAHQSQGRYTYRQKVRTPLTPYRLEQSAERSSREVVLYLLVDRSGSMSTLQDEVQLALMTLYLAAADLDIPTGLAFFGAADANRSDRVLEVTPPVPGASEEAKALIAGYTGDTGAEYLDWGLRLAEAALRPHPHRNKVVIILHDGEPVYDGADGNDWALSYSRIRRMERAGLTTIGVYLGDHVDHLSKVRLLFPRLVVSTGSRLADRLGNLLSGLA